VPFLRPYQEVRRGVPPPPRGAVLSEDAELEKRGFTVGKTLGEGAFGTGKESPNFKIYGSQLKVCD
jgi:hypothetical protein